MIKKTKLIEYLDSCGRFDENTDLILIDELYYNLSVIAGAKKSLRKSPNGVLSPGDKDGKIWHPHPAIAIYNKALDKVLSISARLGLSDGDRRKMGIASDTGGDDDFDKDE